ncbi:hypothetical protein ACOMHN_056513 [Nucella lapillus]
MRVPRRILAGFLLVLISLGCFYILIYGSQTTMSHIFQLQENVTQRPKDVSFGVEHTKTLEDSKKKANMTKGIPQDQKKEPDKGVPQDQKKGTANTKGVPQDQTKGTANTKGVPQDQKTGVNVAKEVPQDQKKGTASTKEVPQDQKKGVPHDQTKANVGHKKAPWSAKKDAINSVIGPRKQGKDAAGNSKSQPQLESQTSDDWPVLSKKFFPGPIPPSPHYRNFTHRWVFNTSEFLQRPDVIGQPHKLITWMVKPRYTPELPEPVSMRLCPEMPCKMTTDRKLSIHSAALVWNGQIMNDPQPPVRPFPDQVFVFHNTEPQKPDWIHRAGFRGPPWKSAFNWTLDYRFDSDIISPFAYVVNRNKPLTKNYTDIVARKTKMAAWLVSHCGTHGKREKYIALLQKHMQVDLYGGCSSKKCPRSQDDSCFKMVNDDYKFYFSMENALCKDYISEKFFRYFEADTVVVARGSNEYANFVPPGTFVNTADFNSTQELAKYLLYLDSHPEEYVKILRAKDQYQPLYEDWPIRSGTGNVLYMEYHYESVPLCELCRRLWDLDKYRKTIPNIWEWFDKANCYPPKDLV